MKVKVIKCNKNSYYYQPKDSETLLRGVIDWEDIEYEEYFDLKQAIYNANLNKKDKYTYILLEQVGDIKQIFDSAAEYIKYVEVEKVKRLKEEKRRKEKEEEAKTLRKQKQFEKLQKELNK